MNKASGHATVLIPSLILKFASVGMLNTVLTVSIIFGMKRLLGASDLLSNLTGYVAGLTLSFVLNKRWTFEHEANSWGALTRFLLVFAVAYLFNLCVVFGMIAAGANDYFAHLVGMPVYTAIFYIGCRAYAFRENSASDQPLHAALTRENIKWYGLSLFALCAVIFYRLGGEPVAVWDEARLANNAIEMAQSGLSLITTYDLVPDHWNTKPPLLIWLMSSSMRLFGVSEWAMRLPSALASVGTASLMFWLCAVRLKRPLAGALAVLFLLCTPGFFVLHGARAGDYDALLTFCTTAYLVAFYIYVSGSSKNIALSLFTLLVAASFLTKTIQGMIFLPALAIFLMFYRDSRLVLRHKPLYLGATVVALMCVSYYAVRDHIDPGYFKAALANDLGGRYSTAIENHKGEFYWYLIKLEVFPWTVPAVLLSAALFRNYTAEQRRLSLFFATAIIFYLIVISSASTKLAWYAIPLTPLSALLMGIALEQALATWRHINPTIDRSVAARGFIGLAAFALLIVAYDVVTLERRARAMSVDEFDQYSVFIRKDIMALPVSLPIVIVHPGYPNGQGDRFYIAPVKFYAAALREKGHTVQISQTLASTVSANAIVVTCGNEAAASLQNKFRMHTIIHREKCYAFRLHDHPVGASSVQSD